MSVSAYENHTLIDTIYDNKNDGEFSLWHANDDMSKLFYAEKYGCECCGPQPVEAQDLEPLTSFEDFARCVRAFDRTAVGLGAANEMIIKVVNHWDDGYRQRVEDARERINNARVQRTAALEQFKIAQSNLSDANDRLARLREELNALVN
jgi:hypothetical protein